MVAKKRTEEAMNRKYGVYQALRKALGRSKVNNPGTTASFLLEAFLEKNGVIWAKNVEEKELCEKNKFKEWRFALIKSGWIKYDFREGLDQNRVKHEPGSKLVPYLNREIQKTKQIATRDDIERLEQATEEKVKDLVTRSEMQLEVKKCVAEAEARLEERIMTVIAYIESKDPPVTRQKIEYRMKMKFRKGKNGFPELLD